MQDTLPFLSKNNPPLPLPLPLPSISSQHDFPSICLPNPRRRRRKTHLRFPPTCSFKTITAPPPLPPNPNPNPNPKPSFPHNNINNIKNNNKSPLTSPISPTDFEEKMLYLDSLGLDSFSLIQRHPPIITAPLHDLKSAVRLLSSFHFAAPELRRILSMCPQILTSSSSLLPVFTFLLREARVDGPDGLRRAINRRPRLLACSVEAQLRPTLYFLHSSIGIAEVKKHTSLLSCSVEEKLIPRMDYFQKMGFSHKGTVSMFRRFPQLFNYSVKDNYEPKLNYFVVEMGRELKEIQDFPQYFSFSLENRIKPRHQRCVDKGVCFPLPVLLKTTEVEFRSRLDLCCDATMPFKASPLWTGLTDLTAVPVQN